ncbi:DUF2235 domain-containing protein [Stenotrophomonas rhizophila]
MTATDPTAIPGQVDLEPGSPEPVADADPTARTARLARGTRPMTDAERQQRQAAQSCTLPEKEEATTGCSQSLQVTVYFDGTGNNRDAEMEKQEDERALSNIARLHSARISGHRNVLSTYLAGVGTPCPEVGDSGGMLGPAIGKGGRERIDHALEQLDTFITQQAAQMRIVVVNVSVFGFSRGAAQARGFIRDLVALCKRQPDGTWMYNTTVPMRIGFAGLYDTVVSVWPSLAHAAVNAGNGHNGWGEGMRIPPMVVQSVHMTAAHELRGQFPLDSTRDDARYPDNTQEIWYPGVHSDVGGGYDPQHRGRQNSIARFALNEMYDIALAGGVLLHPMSRLDPEVLAEFDKSDPELQAVYNAYLQAVRVKRGRMEDVQAAHMELLHRWLKVRVARGDKLPSMQRLQERQDALDAEVKTLRRRRAQLGDPYARDGGPSDMSSEQLAEWNRVSDELSARNDALSEVKKQRKGLASETDTLVGKMVSLRRKRERGKRLTLAERTMLDARDNKQLLPEAVETFFDGYGHDSISHWFIGNLAMWRVLYFGDTKYKPGDIEEGAAAPRQRPSPRNLPLRERATGPCCVAGRSRPSGYTTRRAGPVRAGR